MKYGFMAGCSLSSSSPKQVAQIIEYLQGYYPDLAVIQGCCGKPTRLIGQEQLFQERFSHLTDQVHQAEIDELIVACQGCIKTMTIQNQFPTASLWVKMAELGLPEEALGKAKDSDVVFSIQDSCPTKEMTEIHQAVRYLLDQLGYQVARNRLSGKNTLCCGMGGMCGVTNPVLAKSFTEKRVQDFKTDHIVTYCASCTSAMILGGGQAWHLLDLIFGDVIYQEDNSPAHPLASPVKAWKNRYQSKKIVTKI
ncbi:(Fe-S)-binding protein [Enterococcus xiangfangensis]|uniref:(Fe-S)-binding protein n=1 Tax=Enterococcus xiangfangensis TaxID=1296537 RepID=A0ABU3FCZ3_9ENTE|nr:(Fe-S)-binding protein [Enterococcus xiangfangensis]MBM7711576.1 Fe-S oxidoreductase [Enterococcus xiangfangensis]MDT2760360.1 (Fe-S)-binding protein [Enterococcus xiangfangensis]NBK09348.1 (Fe-S)-binding protein [Enterococcus asini]